MPLRPYRYRFWGLPMGVSMLPRLAPMVCMHTTGRISFCRASGPRLSSTTKAKGTKVSSETSLVMNMLPKKHSPTSTSTSCRVPPVRASRARPIRSNTPCCRSPAITVIREKRMASVR